MDLIRSLVDMFKCFMESDLWNALFSAHTNIIYPFVLVSVLASMHACTVWYEPSLLGLSSVKSSRIFGQFIYKKNSAYFPFLSTIIICPFLSVI